MTGTYAPPPPASGTVRPSAGWFGAAAGIAVVAVVIGVIIAVKAVVGVGGRVDDFQRFDLPADEAEVRIDEPGDYSIYHEFPGAREEPAPALVVQLEPEDGGESIPLDTYFGDVTYGISGHEGIGRFTFRVDRAGTYLLTAEGGGLADEQVAVGLGIGAGLLGGILMGVGIAAAGVIAAIILTIVIGVKRGRARRQLRR